MLHGFNLDSSWGPCWASARSSTRSRPQEKVSDRSLDDTTYRPAKPLTVQPTVKQQPQRNLNGAAYRQATTLTEPNATTYR